MLRKRLSAAMILVLLIGFGGGCDELLNQDGDDPLAALVGTWIVTNYTMVNAANTSQTVNLYALGYRVTLVVESDGSYTITFTDSEGSDTDTGTLEVTSSEITVTSDGDTESFTLSYLLVAGILTLTDDTAEYDFDSDGTAETATSIMVFQQPGSGGDLSLDDLAGAFYATSIVVSENANPSNSTELISRGGFYTFVLQADGTIDVVMLFPGQNEEDDAIHLTGTASLVNNGTGIHADFPGTEGDGTSDIQLVGTTLILTRSDITWNLGAGEVPATIAITLVPVTGPTVADLEGYWSETSQLLINPDNPSQTYDYMGHKIAMTVQFTSGGTFRMWDLRYRESDLDEYDTDVGEDVFTMIGNVLQIGTTDPLLVQLIESGSNIILKGYDNHDFDDDGTNEWAALQMTFEPITEHTMAELAGAWSATHWTYVAEDNPSNTMNAITDRLDIVTWVFEAGGAFEVVQSRVDEDIDQFSGTAELFGDILRADDGSGNYHYVVFDLSGSAMEFSMSDWTDPFETGTSSSWRVDVRMVPVTPATSADFEGDWVGSKWELSDPDGVHAAYDMIADGGSFSLTINSGGTFSFSIAFPGETAENGTGTWEIFGDLLLLTDDADGYVSAMQYTTGTDTFTMYSNNDVWDFDEDGVDDPALLNITVIPPGGN